MNGVGRTKLLACKRVTNFSVDQQKKVLVVAGRLVHGLMYDLTVLVPKVFYMPNTTSEDAAGYVRSGTTIAETGETNGNRWKF